MDPLPLPVALLAIGVLYGLPGLACWLAFRTRRNGWALAVSTLATVATAYPAWIMFPERARTFISG
jgi:hypothetical protein